MVCNPEDGNTKHIVTHYATLKISLSDNLTKLKFFRLFINIVSLQCVITNCDHNFLSLHDGLNFYSEGLKTYSINSYILYNNLCNKYGVKQIAH